MSLWGTSIQWLRLTLLCIFFCPLIKFTVIRKRSRQQRWVLPMLWQVVQILVIVSFIFKPETRDDNRPIEDDIISTTPTELTGMKNDLQVATWLLRHPTILDLALKMRQAEQSHSFDAMETSAIVPQVMQDPLAIQHDSVSYLFFVWPCEWIECDVDLPFNRDLPSFWWKKRRSSSCERE